MERKIKVALANPKNKKYIKDAAVEKAKREHVELLIEATKKVAEEAGVEVRIEIEEVKEKEKRRLRN